jgi:hypothetical protein
MNEIWVLRARSRLSKRDAALLSKIEDNFRRLEQEKAEFGKLLQDIFDMQTRASEDMISLKARSFSIKVDREKACNASAFIRKALSSQIGRSIGDGIDTADTHEVDMSPMLEAVEDGTEVLRLLALLITMGISNLEKMNNSKMKQIDAYHLMDLGTKIEPT